MKFCTREKTAIIILLIFAILWLLSAVQYVSTPSSQHMQALDGCYNDQNNLNNKICNCNCSNNANNIPMVSNLLLSDMHPRYSLAVQYPTADLPQQFWEKRVNVSDSDAVHKLPNTTSLILTVHSIHYNGDKGRIDMITSIEWAEMKFFNVVPHAHQYFATDWYVIQFHLHSA